MVVNKPTRYYSSRQEKAVAKAVNGKKTANSGAAMFCAGDVVSKDVLYECKTVMKESGSFSVKKSVLDKARQEAFAMNKRHAVLVFNFKPDGEMYYVLDQKHYLELLESTHNSEK